MSGVTQQLALSINEQTKLLEYVVNKRRSACKKKQTKRSEFLDSTQNVILMLSSVNSYLIPNKPTVLCRNFYTKKLTTKSQDFLNKKLAAADCIAPVNSGCVLAL